jgi:hypothetical protein
MLFSPVSTQKLSLFLMQQHFLELLPHTSVFWKLTSKANAVLRTKWNFEFWICLHSYLYRGRCQRPLCSVVKVNSVAVDTYLWMETAQWPARARGMASSNTSMDGVSQAIVSRLRHAKLLVHFHSFSWVATSSMTKGTQPPKINILKKSKQLSKNV